MWESKQGARGSVGLSVYSGRVSCGTSLEPTGSNPGRYMILFVKLVHLELHQYALVFCVFWHRLFFYGKRVE